MEPSRATHIDYSVDGLRRTARECRKDIAEMAVKCLEKEARGERARYAAYSVWRPVEVIRKDPLAVCDWRSIEKKQLSYFEYRCLSNVTKSGEYMMDSIAMNIPDEKQKKQMRWYFVPEQKPDEVLILKFADTAVEWDQSVAGGCPHGSPVLVDAGNCVGPRLSIECRVLAFWE